MIPARTPSFPRLASPISNQASRPEPLPLAGLLLDVDGVLYDDSAWKRWMFQLVCRFRSGCTYQHFGDLWESHFVVPTACGYTSCREALRGCLAELNLTRCQLDEACAAGIARQRRLQESHQPLPGVRRALTLLQARNAFTVGLGHCPCGTEQLRGQLAKLGLQKQVHRLFSVREFAEQGLYDQRFVHLRRLIAGDTGRVAFVSARSSELAAAQRAGFVPIVFGEGDYPDAVACLEQLDEILDLVRFENPVNSRSA